MDNIELVCIVCKKEDRGGGIWAFYDDPSTWEQEDGLCPDCRQELFPEFGKGDGRYINNRFNMGNLLRFIFTKLGDSNSGMHKNW